MTVSTPAVAVKTAAVKPDTTTVTTTRKTAPKATPAKATGTRRKAAKKAPAAPVEAPRVKKSDIPEADRDWTYLAEKAPTDLHEDFAVWLQEEIGMDIDLKTVQAVCVLRMVYQRSDRNKARGAYRPLDETVVGQRSAHMIAAHADAKAIRDEQAAAADAKKAKAAAARKARAAKKAAPEA